MTRMRNTTLWAVLTILAMTMIPGCELFESQQTAGGQPAVDQVDQATATLLAGLQRAAKTYGELASQAEAQVEAMQISQAKAQALLASIKDDAERAKAEAAIEKINAELEKVRAEAANQKAKAAEAEQLFEQLQQRQKDGGAGAVIVAAGETAAPFAGPYAPWVLLGTSLIGGVLTTLRERKKRDATERAAADVIKAVEAAKASGKLDMQQVGPVLDSMGSAGKQLVDRVQGK